MVRATQRLLIISRDTLLEIEAQPFSKQIFRLLARLNRLGYHLLLTASEPDRWVPTRGNVDEALSKQLDLKEKIQLAGGELEGIYYVHRSLFTQDRNRMGALKDILQRYAVSSRQSVLLSSSVPFLKAADRLGIQTHKVLARAGLQNNLRAVLEKLIQSI